MATTAKIGTILVSIEARVDNMERELKKAQGRLARFDKATQVTASSIRYALSAALAAVPIQRFISSIEQSTAEIDRLAKTSQKLGIATEQLAGLRHAANLTGVESNTLDMALQRMVRRLSEAAIDTGEAKGALFELGLAAKELNQLSPDRQFAAIAEAMSTVNNEADRVRLAFKLFDSEGVALVNTLKLGSAGLRQAAEDAERLGLAIKEEDAAKVERLSDAMANFKKAISGGSNSLTIAIAPAAAETLEGFTLAWTEFNRAQAGAGESRPTSNEENRRLSLGGGLFPGQRRAMERAAEFAFEQIGRRADVTNADLASRGIRGAEAARLRLARNRFDHVPNVANRLMGGDGARADTGDAPRHFVRSNFASSALGRMPGMIVGGITRAATDAADALSAASRAAHDMTEPARQFASQMDKNRKDWERVNDLRREEMETLTRFANSVAEEVLTPQERFDREQQMIMNALGAGLLTNEQASRATRQARDNFMGREDTGNRFNSLIEGGTSEAFTALRRNLRDGGQKKLLDVNREQLDAMRGVQAGIDDMVTIFDNWEVVN